MGGALLPLIKIYEKRREIIKEGRDLKISNLPMSLADRKAAIQFYQTFIEKYPNYATAWYAKGLALTRLRIYDEAMNCFSRSIENDPKAAGGFKSHSTNVANNK